MILNPMVPLSYTQCSKFNLELRRMDPDEVVEG